jgi:mannitol/fructose-specific phosphotransferase system IIA component (Ntr-type)
MFRLSENLAPEAILCGCKIASRDELLTEIVRTAGAVHGWNDADEIVARVVAREAQMSTAIGQGIAVPHARLEWLDRIQVAVACLPDGLDFRAPDRKPVRLVLLLVSPISAPAIHVQALAAVSRIKMPFVERLVGSSTPAEFLHALAEWETSPAK